MINSEPRKKIRIQNDFSRLLHFLLYPNDVIAENLGLLGKLLGEYHKNETIKPLALSLSIYIGLLGHLQELQETENTEFFWGVLYEGGAERN